MRLVGTTAAGTSSPVGGDTWGKGSFDISAPFRSLKCLCKAIIPAAADTGKRPYPAPMATAAPTAVRRPAGRVLALHWGLPLALSCLPAALFVALRPAGADLAAATYRASGLGRSLLASTTS